MPMCPAFSLLAAGALRIFGILWYNWEYVCCAAPGGALMLNVLSRFLERFWIWLGGELPAAETGVAVGPGPDQIVYVVQTGDTLSSIARRFSSSIWILADLNNLDDPGLIRAGQRLLIPRPGVRSPVPSVPSEYSPEPLVETEPGPFIYIVQTGDTLSAIARRFGVSVAAIIETNRIQDRNLAWPGQRLLIPGPKLQPEPELAPLPHEPSAPPPEPEPISLPVAESEPESVAAPEPIPGQYVYVVQPGDTLMVLARRFNATLRAIIEANDIEDPNVIRPGQRLVIPGVALPPTLTSVPEPSLPGPEPVPVSSDEPTDTSLLPISWPDDAILGIYVPYSAIGHQAHRRHVIDILTKTEINALVIDVKGDQGLIGYPTGVSLAHEIGAAQPTAHDFDELMDFFKANGVYTIARIVAFRDHPLATAHPEWATQREEGGVWHDGEGWAWVDPFVQSPWEYNADLAEEAACRGFDEIQLDYVCFPTPSQEGTPYFLQPLSRETRIAVIAAFLSYIRGRLAPLHVRIASNVFGYTCWRKDDMLIGQDIERMAQHLDVLCPILYPSAFESGIPDYKNAIAFPYHIVYESMKQAVRRVQPLGCHVRPWIQDFPDHRFDKRVYGPAEIRAQMQGSLYGGGIGYMAWDPQVKYTTRAYFKKAIDMSLSDDYN
jgi:LysM repeat protein